jgi:hypothetical protein
MAVAAAALFVVAGCGSDDGGHNAAPSASADAADTTSTEHDAGSDAGRFSGEISSGTDLAQRKIALRAGDALRVKVDTSGELEAHVAVLGDIRAFMDRWGGENSDGDGLRDFMSEAGFQDRGARLLDDVLERFDNLPGTPLVGSKTLYDDEGFNEGGEVTDPAWVDFVAPQDGTYYIIITSWDENEHNQGAFTASIDTEEAAEAAGDEFDPSQAAVLTADEYDAALSAHEPFLRDPAFFPPKDFVANGTSYGPASR